MKYIIPDIDIIEIKCNNCIAASFDDVDNTEIWIVDSEFTI